MISEILKIKHLKRKQSSLRTRQYFDDEYSVFIKHNIIYELFNIIYVLFIIITIYNTWLGNKRGRNCVIYLCGILKCIIDILLNVRNSGRILQSYMNMLYMSVTCICIRTLRIFMASTWCIDLKSSWLTTKWPIHRTRDCFS